jgi:hypothetical protein
MRKKELTAESIGIEKPCSESWDEMTGDEKTRGCSHCAETVTDISMLTEEEAFELIERSNGTICVRYEAHPETGAPLFAQKLYQITRQTGVTAGVLGATLAVSSTAADAQSSNSMNHSNPAKTTISIGKYVGVKDVKTKQPTPFVSPTPIKRPPQIMGKIAIRYRVSNSLLQAVDRGSYLKTRLMIARGVDVNEIDLRYHSRTALHLAVERNNLRMVNLLLNAGANVHARDRIGETPLMMVNRATSKEIIRTLVQYAADINTQNSIGRTPLFNAVIYNNLEATRALLEAGADPNIEDNYKNSALELAGTDDIKQILIAYGAEQSAGVPE